MPPNSETDAAELANGDSASYIRKMDRRLVILETRFDTILPTLATKADLVELRAEMRAMNAELRADMQKWMTTTLISMFVGFGGLLIAMIKLVQPV
ncbi:MAG: hypothetical protein V4693_13345 [Pseudomonadota bacterium]